MDFKELFFIFAGLGCAFWIITSSNPIRNLLMLLAFFYVFPVGWIFYQYTGILLVDVPILALLGFALINGQPLRFYFKEMTLSVLIMVLWMCVTTTQALEPGWSIAEISKWIRGYLIFVCLANFIKTEKDLRAILFVILAGFAFEVFVGLHQWRRGNVGIWFLGERMWRPEWWRAYGTFYVPSFFGNYLIMILPIVLRLLIFYKPPQKWETYLYGFLMATGSAALYATLARGPWISFAAAVVIMLLFTFFKSKLRPKLKWPMALAIVFIFAFTHKYLPRIIEQFGEHRKTAAMSRVYLGQVALRLIEDNPIFGTGPANYETLSPRYVVPIEEYPAALLSERVHNTYLLVLAENGIPGGIAFAFVLLQMCLICIRLFRSNNKLVLNLAIGVFMALVAMIISFIASPDIHHEQTLNQMFLLVGMVYAGELMERRHRAAVRQAQRRQRREALLARQHPQERADSSSPVNGHSLASNKMPETGSNGRLQFQPSGRAPGRRP